MFSDSELSDVIESMDQLESSNLGMTGCVDEKVDEVDIDTLWSEAIETLISTCEENQYKPRWVYYRLEKLQASRLAWDRYASWVGYKQGWASIQFAKQEGVLAPPTQKKMLLGISSTRVSRERQKERKRKIKNMPQI